MRAAPEEDTHCLEERRGFYNTLKCRERVDYLTNSKGSRESAKPTPSGKSI